jgi:UDP-N-acetyl-D-mannosaminuronic acid transferase (WecB/TagA/CpsF family)
MEGRSFEQILGIRFFNGTVEEAVAQMWENGGVLVAPSGTCFERFIEDQEYRRALISADVVLPDSGLMVALWRFLRGRSINRISGLAFLKQLLGNPAFGHGEKTCWVLPNERARDKLLAWSAGGDCGITRGDCYIAPIYRREVQDEILLALIESRQPRHIIIAIGAGAQEKLGWFLRSDANYRPAIHCIGGALGFVTGDQVAIPDWADRLYLGWFLRLLSQPRAFVPRLWKARFLPWLIWKYGAQMPPLRTP